MSRGRIPMQRWRQLFPAIVLLVAPAASAQVIPWVEPLILREEARMAAGDPTERPPRRPREKRPRGDRTPLVPVREAPAMLHAHALPEVIEILLSGFDGGAGAGHELGGTSWAGNVIQHAQFIAVGGTASDDNGWGARNITLDASGMSFLTVTARRDAGNQAPTLFFQFEDRSLRTRIFSVNTALFAMGTFTTVQIPLGAWTIDFGVDDITAWSLGGGSVGTVPLRMSFDTVGFSATAIPEPATFGAAAAVLALGVAAGRHRRQGRSGSGA